MELLETAPEFEYGAEASAEAAHRGREAASSRKARAELTFFSGAETNKQWECGGGAGA